MPTSSLEKKLASFSHKSQRRQIAIIEAAIRLYATSGAEKATFEKIAQRCGVTRPLVQHYFKNRETLFRYSLLYIRERFQTLAIDALKKGKTPREQLAAYVGSTFVWMKKYPTHAKTWALLFYYCTHRPSLRRLHTEMVLMGQERITQLIEAGNAHGEFANPRPKEAAKLIQTTITGALITLGTEENTVSPQTYQQQIGDHCLQIAKNGL